MGPKGISRVVNQGLARQHRQGYLLWTVARDGRFCHFGNHDPTWRTPGALMPGPQREPGWVRAPGSSYSKGIGSVASSLPLAGPGEGSIVEFFKLISVWAETAHFQLPTPEREWRGHSSGSERNWDLPFREHRERLSVGLGATWFPGTSLWLGETPPLWAGVQGPD